MTPRDRRAWHTDRRFWYGVVAVAAIIVLLIIGWAAGWFAPSPEAPAIG